MAKEILLYTPIYSSTAEKYINLLEDNKNSDIKVRVNCPGGSVYDAYGMIAKFAEHKKGKCMQVDGFAASCAFIMCCAADSVECLNVSEFLAHRAAYPSWIENDKELFNDAAKEQLNKTNANLRAIIESKVSAETFKKVTGVSLDDMFSLDSRIDVEISADQAKKMGIVTNIVTLTKEKKQEVEALAATHGIAAFSKTPEVTAQQPANNNSNNTAMTLAEFKAANTTLYNEIVAAAREEGVKAERDRVAAWQEWASVDPEGVAKAIADGSQIAMKDISALSAKAMSKSTLEAVKKDNPEKVATPQAADKAPTAEDLNTQEFLKNCKDEMGLNKK